MALPLQLQRFTARINALDLRQRMLIFMMAALALITVVYSVLINPLMKQQQQLSQKITENQGKINTLQMQIQMHMATKHIDPNAPLRARLEQFKEVSVNLRHDLNSIKDGLVTPQQMPMLLKDILRGNHSLRLTSMKTLPTQHLGVSANEDVTKIPNTMANSVPEVGAYKHGFEITLQGEYLDMLGYLSAIEASPWRVFWGNAELNADTYPKTVLTLKLYTLSMDQAWLTL